MKYGLLVCLIFVQLFPLTGVIPGGNQTGEKPQSKAWFAHGKWWCCLNGKIFRMTDNQFTEVQTLPSGVGPADTKWNGTDLFIMMTSYSIQRFYKYTYNPVPDNYTIVSGFPVVFSPATGNSLGSPETIVLDQDSSGRIWATLEKDTVIKVFWTESEDHRIWNTQGHAVGTGVKDDDISTITALPGGAMGVLWSNQNDHRVHFRMHLAGTPETLWTQDEVCNGQYVADDHMNIAVAPDGRVFVAVKTSNTSPILLLLERELSGRWNQYPVTPDCGTRPNVMYNREKDEILYTYQTTEGTGFVVLQRTPAGAIVLNAPDTVIPYAGARNVTGTKQVLDAQSGCLILAQNDTASSTYFYHVALDSGNTAAHYSMPSTQAIVEAFPNPFYSVTTIHVKGLTGGRLQEVRLFNVKGELARNFATEAYALTDAPFFRLDWNAEDFPAGVYVLKIRIAGREMSKMLFKRK